ncbi:MAG: MFS transporter [Aestuariibacter sp.]
MNRTELRGALSLALIYLMRMLGLFMVMPVLALMVQDYPDYSVMWLGLAIGAYGFTQAILQIPMGMWSDRIGRKKVIVAGLVLFASGSLLAATAESMWLLTLGRMLQGAGAIAGAVMALAADISREQQRSKVMAVIGIAIGFSFYLSLILGPIVSGDFGLSGIFYLTFGLALAGIPVVLFMVPNAVAGAPNGDTLPARQHIKSMLQDKALLTLNISVMFLHALITMMFVQLPGKLVASGWVLEEHWLVYLPVLLMSIVGMAILMGLQRKLNINKLLMLAVWCLTLSLASLAIILPQGWGLLAWVVVFFIGFNFLEANFPALVSSLAPAGRKGTAMGLFASFQFFGAFLGGVLSGLLLNIVSGEMLLGIMAVVCIGWSLLFMSFDSAGRTQRYTLSFKLAGRTLEEVRSGFAQLNGVQDFSIVPDESAVYLKVDGKQFDVQQARQLADPG